MNKKHNFIIVSEDKIVIDSKISKIIEDSELNLKETEIVKIDMSEKLISNIIEELDTYNFLSNCKVVICYNCKFIEGEVNSEIKYLKSYLANPGENYLIMIASKVSDKKEIKELVKDIEIIDSKISSELLIKRNLQEFKMENNTVKYFVAYCLGNNEKILNELEKIKCYKQSDPNKLITPEDINKLVLKDYDEDIFDLVNAIAKKDKENAFAVYTRLIKKEKDAINIVASIASRIRLLYSVKVLSNSRKSVNEMAKIINVKTMAVSIALENSYNFSEKKLLSLLNELAEIDYKTKSGNTTGNILFETFLMGL